MDEEGSERLRTPPAERFAGRRHHVSLPEELEELRREDHPARGGHRQVTLHQHGAVTQVLFSFEEGGLLERHSAPGLVTIHVLDGRLGIEADGRAYVLEEDHVLILEPGVPHDVRADVPSAMLLTVHLEKVRLERAQP